MYTTNPLWLFWLEQPPAVHLMLLSQFGLLVIAVVRFVKSARGLYRHSGDRILLENVLKGEADPEQLAASALAHRRLGKAVWKKVASPEGSREIAKAKHALHVLHGAES